MPDRFPAPAHVELGADRDGERLARRPGGVDAKAKAIGPATPAPAARRRVSESSSLAMPLDSARPNQLLMTIPGTIK